MQNVAGSHESRRGLKHIPRPCGAIRKEVAGSHESRRGLKPISDQAIALMSTSPALTRAGAD